jgi:sterol 3beta-glucosyltransferase
MRIGVLAVGSHGDVRPFAALGGGLAAKGYDVRLISHAPFAELARAAGLGFSPVEGNPMDIVRGENGQAWLDSMDKPLRFLSRLSPIAGEVLDALSMDALEGARGCDALVYSLPLGVSGFSISEGLGIPGIPGSLYPLHPTGAFPSVIVPSLPLGGKTVNRMSARVAATLFWRLFRSHHDEWRRKTLGLPPLPRRVPFRLFEDRGTPYLYGYSPSLVPNPQEWTGLRIVCGYWFLDRPAKWKPPEDLVAFIDSGPAPIYAGFGSMAGADGRRLAGIIAGALRITGQRGILATGWGGLSGEDLPSFAFPVGSVPHDWLLPRTAAAIHHGGAGTTAAALRAGIPSIIVPYFADQFFWGRRIYERGLGPRALDRKKLDVESLARAIRFALEKSDVRANCREISTRIEIENGVAKAAGVVDDYLLKKNLRVIQ